MEDSGLPARYWGVIACDLLSTAFFVLQMLEQRKLKQLRRALPLDSVSSAKEFRKCLPMLVGVRGVVNSDRPMIGKMSSTKAVILEEKEGVHMLKHCGNLLWIPESKLLKHDRQTREWFISDDGGRSRLWVEDAFEADRIEDALKCETRIQGGLLSKSHHLVNQRSGCHPTGSWETERSLPVGTTVTVVGELARTRGSKRGDMVIRRPSEAFGRRPFYITCKSFENLRRSLLRKPVIYKVLAECSYAVGAVLLGIQIWQDVRSMLRRRQTRRRAAEQERRRQGLGHEITQPSVQSEQRRSQDPSLYAEDEGKCVICWDRRTDAIFLPCGHLCACLHCARELDQCPLCRRQSRVQQVFTA